jgi:hypothetical protein
MARLCAQRCLQAGSPALSAGATSPTQLRALMKRDPRDLLGEFRALAPHRRPSNG